MDLFTWPVPDFHGGLVISVGKKPLCIQSIKLLFRQLFAEIRGLGLSIEVCMNMVSGCVDSGPFSTSFNQMNIIGSWIFTYCVVLKNAFTNGNFVSFLVIETINDDDIQLSWRNQLALSNSQWHFCICPGNVWMWEIEGHGIDLHFWPWEFLYDWYMLYVLWGIKEY